MNFILQNQKLHTQNQNIDFVGHRCYCPDVAPNDFFVSPYQ